VIGIVDYGMGNRRSVEKAFLHVGADAVVTNDQDALHTAEGLVVPGVGAFPRGMEKLRDLGLDELLRARFAAGTPMLGICLGMELAFESSTELGGAPGLGLVPGTVERLDAGALKLPHIGWNLVTFTRQSALTEGVPTRSAFYHVHSYAPRPASQADVLGNADYGGPFVTAVAHGSFFGLQFHPEKSSVHGLRLLANFASICDRQAADALA
jgi:glutamine amidotransferase